MKRHPFRRSAVGLTVVSLAVPTALLALAHPAEATPVARQFRIADTDWTSGAVGGIGSASAGGGTGTIGIDGISGTVTHAYLSWHGVGPLSGGASFGTYDNPTISVNGTTVTGVSQGESGSNCWGDGGTARTYLADVTSIVTATGNGDYELAGLGDGGDANGANLVVTYDDADATNDRDLYLFYGNDTDAGGFPGEDTIWDDPLTDLNYPGGQANLELAVADGQDFGGVDDGALTVSGPGGAVSYQDEPANNGLWDGLTVEDAGHSRAPNGSLYDLQTFDVTSTFAAPGVADIAISADLVNDCHAVVMAAVDLAASGAQPPAPASVSVAPTSVSEGTASGRKPTTIMKFKVTLSAKQTSAVTVSLTTQDGTAVAPADYRSRSQVLTIPAGKTSKIFKVKVVPDADSEGNEFLYAVITGASVPVATNAAVGQITDDDGGTARAQHRHAQPAPLHPGGR